MRYLLLTVIVIIAVSSTASARTWYITPDGTGDAPTIRAGTDSASAGDTVLVACGTFYEYGVRIKPGVCLRPACAQRRLLLPADMGRGFSNHPSDHCTVT